MEGQGQTNSDFSDFHFQRNYTLVGGGGGAQKGKTNVIIENGLIIVELQRER